MPSLMATSCAGVHTPLGPKCILCLKAMFLYIKGNHQKKVPNFGFWPNRGEGGSAREADCPNLGYRIYDKA